MPACAIDASLYASVMQGAIQWIERHMVALILGGFALGILAGLALGPAAAALAGLSDIFVRLIRAIVGPLILTTVASAIHMAGRQQGAGRLIAHVVLSFLGLTAVALALGMAGALLFQPGVGVELPGGADMVVTPAKTGVAAAVPDSLFDALSRTDTLQLVVFALVLGWACLRAGTAGQKVAAAFDAVASLLFAFTRLVVLLAPLAAFGATAALVGARGLAILSGFAAFAGVVFGALALLGLLVIPLYLKLHGVSVRQAWRLARSAILVAFATASGAAALAICIESLVEGGIDRRIAAFVPPLGAVFNLTGSTLFVGAATLFLLQANGIRPDTAMVAMIFGSLFFVTKAIPAVPRASMAVLAAYAGGLGLPAEAVAAGIGALLAVDALLDMTRTATNMWGHAAVAVAVAAKP